MGGGTEIVAATSAKKIDLINFPGDDLDLIKVITANVGANHRRPRLNRGRARTRGTFHAGFDDMRKRGVVRVRSATRGGAPWEHRRESG